VFFLFSLTGYSAAKQQALRGAALGAGRLWRHVLTLKLRHSFFGSWVWELQLFSFLSRAIAFLVALRMPTKQPCKRLAFEGPCFLRSAYLCLLNSAQADLVHRAALAAMSLNPKSAELLLRVENTVKKLNSPILAVLIYLKTCEPFSINHFSTKHPKIDCT